MYIEFKLEDATHRETFEALTDMLAVIDRANILTHEVCSIMDADEAYLDDITELTYFKNDFMIIFKYDKLKGKISLKSSKVKRE